jgi:cell division septum initiation protein DivIVA
MKTSLKKLTAFICIIVYSSFSLMIFSQNNVEEKISSINKNIIYLKQDNNKIKQEIDSLNNLLVELQLLIKNTNKTIAEVQKSKSEADKKLVDYQDNTNQRFLKYKQIIKISLLVATIVGVLIFIILIISRIKRKKTHRILKNLIVINEKGILNNKDKNAELFEKYNDLLIKLEEQSTFCSELSSKFNLKFQELNNQINSFNEINNARISETQKLLDNKFLGLINTNDRTYKDSFKQLNNKVVEIKNELTDVLNKLKEENLNNINLLENKLLNEISEVKKMFENKD